MLTHGGLTRPGTFKTTRRMNPESDFKNHKITFGEEILAGSVGYHNLPVLIISTFLLDSNFSINQDFQR